MEELTTKELLHNLISLQEKQINELTEIKTCLLGDEYHPDGLVNQVKQHDNCIDDIKRNRIPKIEKDLEKRTGMIGGAIAFVTVAGTTFVNWLIFKE